MMALCMWQNMCISQYDCCYMLQVQQEQVSGQVHMSLLGASFGNMYQNLTNILLMVTPKAAADVPAVLVNAHYDTAIGSPGEIA